MRIPTLMMAVSVLATGCTQAHLRVNTVHKADSIADLYQQQVLNNLAMFATNPDALPYFALPSQGTSAVNDSIMGNTTLGWVAAGFQSVGLQIAGSRAQQENWVLEPVKDPHKLALMRCAYQQAISTSFSYSDGTPIAASTSCPNCKTRWKNFYEGHPHGDEDDPNHRDDQVCLTSDCSWINSGSWWDVPHDCDRRFVGKYGHTYVWVLPEGRAQFAKLTMAVLDYAVHDPGPATPISKKVVYYLNKKGIPTQKWLAVGEVSANIGIDERNTKLLTNALQREREDATRDTPKLDTQLKNLTNEKSLKPDQLRLKRQYIPRRRTDMGRPSLQGLQLRLDAASPR